MNSPTSSTSFLRPPWRAALALRLRKLLLLVGAAIAWSLAVIILGALCTITFNLFQLGYRLANHLFR